MIILAAGGTIQAVASVGSTLSCYISGMELNGSVKTYKPLYQGQLPSSVGALYTVSAGITAFISSIVIVNTNLTTPITFQLFANGSDSTKAITSTITLGAGLQATLEDGANGWTMAIIQPGTTLLNDIHSGYSDYNAIALPAAPPVGVVRVFGRSLSGRMIPKWIQPSGLDSAVQPALFGNNVITYFPSSSTNGGSATLGGFGMSWTAGGTISHPTPSAGIVAQMRRTRYANVVTTTNQTLGLMSTASGLPTFWRGNAAGLGGFFFFTRFVIGLWPANTCRLFVGFSDSATAQVTLDIASMTGNFIAIAHDTTDGANILWLITRDGTTTHKTAISGATLGAGQGFDFYMYAKPNDNTIYYRIDDINAGTTIVDTGETNNLPQPTAFMGPQVHMSNGTANVTVTTVALEINRIYIESDH